MTSTSFSAWVQEWINQFAHVGWGAFLLMALSQHMTIGHAALWVVAGATVKEGIIDPLTETVAEQGSGLQDWAFWVLGVVLGVLAFIK